MSILTILSGSISRNSFRVARSNVVLVPATALTHSKVDSALHSVDNEQAIKIVTRKKYEDLPTSKKLPDGSIASALDEWPGGLQVPKVPPEAVKGKHTGVARFEIISDPGDQSQEPPRKRRKTRSLRPNDASRETDAASLGEQVPPAKRARAPSKAVMEVEDSRVQGGDICRITNEGRASEDSWTGKNVEDSEIQGSRDFSEERLSLNDLHVVSETLPVKLQRRLKNAAKKSSPILDSGDVDKKRRSPIKAKISRRKQSLETAPSTKDGEQRMPQNQLATQILENLAKFPHCILLTRVGNFYESYFDQAAEVAHLLSIKLTKRTWDRQEVLMCGFPIIHLDKHLKVLLQTHKRCVAMCEEFRRKQPEEGFERRVVRVLTPGTLIDEPFLNPYENNYLLAVGTLPTLENNTNEAPAGGLNLTTAQENLGLAWIDVSTGEFFTQQSTLSSFKDDLTRIGPREVVLEASLKAKVSHPIRLAVADEGSFVSYMSREGSYSPSASNERMASVANADNFRTTLSFSQPTSVFTDHESSAIFLLTTFLQANLLEHMPLLSPPARQGHLDRMQMDSHTIKALEIRESMREGGVTGSLMSVVKRTVTTSGTRLLSRWLCSPSISITEIRARQNLVSLFLSRHHLREDLTLMLKRIEDASRIVQRFLLGKGDVDDLFAIKNAIETWGEIKSRVDMERKLKTQISTGNEDNEWTELSGLLHRMTDLRRLAQCIGMAVTVKNDTGPPGCDVTAEPFPDRVSNTTWAGDFKDIDNKEGGSYKWTIKPDFSPELFLLHARLKEAEAERQRLEEELRRRFNAPSLTLRSSGNHGVHVHIGKSRRDVADIERSRYFIPVASTGSTKSFFNQTWYMLGTRIMDINLKILAAEKNAFEALRQEVNIETGALRRNARIVDELDVTLGFASLATEMNFVRPLLNESTSYLVTNGRHPSVELGLLISGRVFTPNTVSLIPESRLHIITGPNMAGKSTLLRQTALLAVLAQTGSFVPADRAELGIVDKMFSRVGAKDDLFRDRSTFMVEMLETAEILSRATERSLVIMDEVGRGTTVKDGLAIAFATVCHLYNVNRCRTLFATHFHEVADLLGYVEGSSSGAFSGIGFFCTDVNETEDGHFTYSHRLRPGVNRDSHGLKVAQLAGMPPFTMRIAHEALNWMKAKQGSWIADKEQLRIVGEAMITGKKCGPS